MKDRHHRQNGALGGKSDHFRCTRYKRMNDVGAVRIHDALGIARRPGRVTHARGGILVEADPLEIAIGLADPVLVADRVLELGLRHVLAVCEDDVVLERLELVLQRLQQRDKGQIDKDRAVFRMIDNVNDLLGKEARIDRVIDGADAQNAV